MSINFDLWMDLYEQDIEEEFNESGESNLHFDAFVEDRYMNYLDSFDYELDYNEAMKHGLLFEPEV